MDQKGLNFFWKLLHLGGETHKLHEIDYNGHVYRAKSIAGIGSSCTILKYTSTTDGSSNLAMKIGREGDLVHENALIKILAANKIVPGIIQSNLDYTKGMPYLVFPFCKSVVPSLWTDPEDVAVLRPEHFLQLFQKLKLMHELGVLHRDIRPENIVTLGDEAYFIDLNCSIHKGAVAHFEGSVVTASQRILRLVADLGPDVTSEIPYTAEDDLESFFKMWCLVNSRLELPPAPANSWDHATQSLEFWHNHVCIWKIGSISDYHGRYNFIDEVLFSAQRNSLDEKPGEHGIISNQSTPAVPRKRPANPEPSLP